MPVLDGYDVVDEGERGAVSGQGDVAAAGAFSGRGLDFDGAGGSLAVVVGQRQSGPSQTGQQRKAVQAGRPGAFLVRQRGGHAAAFAYEQQARHGRFGAGQFGVAESQLSRPARRQRDAFPGRAGIDFQFPARNRQRGVRLEAAGVESRAVQGQRTGVTRIRGDVGEKQADAKAVAVGQQGKEMLAGGGRVEGNGRRRPRHGHGIGRGGSAGGGHRDFEDVLAHGQGKDGSGFAAGRVRAFSAAGSDLRRGVFLPQLRRQPGVGHGEERGRRVFRNGRVEGRGQGQGLA